MKKKHSTIAWRKLDNTANIFPVIANKKISHVFRLSTTLKEDVKPDILQLALEDVLPWFDAFRVRLRRGIFWFYFEENNRRPLVEKEDTFPCQYIDAHMNQKFLFRVTYYKKRINLEVFHALSDGLGAFTFLKELTYRYLDLVKDVETVHRTKMIPSADSLMDTEDSYTKNYKKKDVKGYSTLKAYRIKGEVLPLDTISVIHGYVDQDGLKKTSKKYGVSVTKYLAAVMIWCIYKEYLNGQPNSRAICLNLPVNLRAFFDSSTLSNFFAVTMIEFLSQSENHTFEDILTEVSKQMDEKIGKKQAEEVIAYNVKAAKNPFIRMAPLFVKNIGMGIVFRRSSKATTMTLSNLGVIKVKPEYENKIERFHAMMGVFKNQEMKCTIVSYNKEVVITFTSVYKEAYLQKAFFRTLAEEGIQIKIESNGVINEKV